MSASQGSGIGTGSADPAHVMPMAGPSRARGASATDSLTAVDDGHVQGVGFRWWTRSRALERCLRGHATNLADGRGQVVAEGPKEKCEELIALLKEQPTTTRRPGTLDLVIEQWASPKGETGFVER